MKTRRKSCEAKPIFEMRRGDHFRSLLMSDPVRTDAIPGCETVLCLYVIDRDCGTNDMCSVLRTWQGDKCVSRHVLSKTDLLGEDLAVAEADRIRNLFAADARRLAGIEVGWKRLDLSATPTRREQARKIRAWGGARALEGMGIG